MKKLLGTSLALVGVVGIVSSALAWGDEKDKTGAAPAATSDSGQSAKVGEKAPGFTLTDTNGTKHTLTETLKKEGVKAVVLEWFDHECPVSKDHAKKKTTIKLTDTYKPKGVVFLGVDSTFAHTAKEADVNKMIKEWGVNYPVLADFDGKVGKSYGAKTTLHMFVINKDGTLVYDGAIDNEKEKTGGETINFVDQALKQVLAGQTVATSKTTPYGCKIKYKS